MTATGATPQIILVASLLLAVGVGGLILFTLGWRGRMVPVRGHCRNCSYTLHDPLPSRCPECGADLSTAEAISWGVSRRRPAMTVIGAGAMLMVVGALIFTPVLMIGRLGMNQTVRTSADLLRLDATALAAEIRGADSDDRIWSAMEVVLASPAFDGERAFAAAEAAIDWSRSESVSSAGPGSVGSVSTMGSALLANIIDSGLLADADIEALLVGAFGRPELLAPRVERVGKVIELRVRPMGFSASRAFSHLKVRPLIDAVSLIGDDGVVAPIDWDPMGADDEPAPDGADALAARFALDEIGPRRLRVESSLEVTVQLDPAPWAVRLNQRTVHRVALPPVEHVIEIVPPEEPLPRSVTDESHVDEIVAAIDVSRVAIARDIDGRQLVLDVALSFRSVDVAALNFEVVALLPGEVGHEIPLGSVLAVRRGMEYGKVTPDGVIIDVPTSTRFSVWAPDLPHSVRSATLEFRPTGSLRATADQQSRSVVDLVWALPIRIENLTLLREDLEGGADR